jgi:hypothetical protein
MMLGRRLRAERRNTCRYGCCTHTLAWRRGTKQERMRDAKTWKQDLWYT